MDLRLFMFVVMKHLYTILLCCLFFLCGNAQTSQVLSGDTLASDFEYLVEHLEATHPDPYSGFGGKFFFRKSAFELENQLRAAPHTLQEFYNRVSIFLSHLQDGHTAIYGLPASKIQKKRVLPLRLKVIPEGLIVTGIPKVSQHLLGSRIIAVNGDSLNRVLTRAAELRACENLYDCYNLVCNQIMHEAFLCQLFLKQRDNVYFTLLTPDNCIEELCLPLLSAQDAYKNITATATTSIKIPDKQLSYKFMDSDKQVMFIKILQVYGRDNFEFIYQNGWDGLMEQMSSCYNKMGKKMPTDTLEAIKNIPSFSEVFAEMLMEMKRNKSHTLIIDLRGNSGGWSPITLPTLYQLYGKRSLTIDMGTGYYQLISPLLLQKQNTDLDKFNHSRNANWKMGDYTLSVKDTIKIPPAIEYLCRKGIYMSSTPNLLTAQNGKPLYTPQEVFVVTDSQTFSAAFHYAFYLWKLGATIVGVPSRQAPNTFMDQTSLKLPYTGLFVSISNSIQVFMPAKDRRAKIFYPDWMPSYEDYKKYNFDTNTEILYLLEKLKKK